MTTSSRGPYGQVYNNTEYRNVTQGFYVTASLAGEIVHLDISSNRDRVSQQQPGVIDIQPKATLAGGEARTDQVAYAGIGVRAYVARRFMLRGEYKEYVIFTDRDENEEDIEWKIGFAFFF